MRKRKRIVVGMSGGVDSSVAAALCAEQGYEVVGVFLRNGVEAPVLPGSRPRCCSAGDAADARGVATALGAAFYAFDESEPFDGLIDAFVDAYAGGRTPNPCVTCNRDIKIAALERAADAVGAARIATGHYARHDASGRRLRRAVDAAKDQTYFLSGLSQAQVERARFPVGALTKAEVRAVARRLGLPVADKPESQEICFVAGSSYRELVAARRPETQQPGAIVDTDGNQLGTHDGIADFTIGQRRGLRIGGGEVRHVVALEHATNRVVVGPVTDLDCTTIHARDVRWWGETPPLRIRARVRIRHRHEPQPGTVQRSDHGAVVELDEPVRGVAPGQVAAFYDAASGEVLLGAGTIVAQAHDDDDLQRTPAAAVPAAQATDSKR